MKNKNVLRGQVWRWWAILFMNEYQYIMKDGPDRHPALFS
jgi:hypothetical protein